jgi:hypothetical protein
MDPVLLVNSFPGMLLPPFGELITYLYPLLLQVVINSVHH